MTKICNKCHLAKEESDFRHRSDNGKLRNECKSCQAVYHDQYARLNPLKLKRYQADYYQKNKARIDLANDAWITEHAEQMDRYQHQYYLDHRPQKRQYQHMRLKIIQQRHKERMLTDMQYKLKHILRHRIHEAMRRYIGGTGKAGSAVKDLGCSVSFLRTWIESQWLPGMSWDNYGIKEKQWSMDHIIALAHFDLTDSQQFQRACHYTNLRPLWHIDNLKKHTKKNIQELLCLRCSR